MSCRLETRHLNLALWGGTEGVGGAVPSLEASEESPSLIFSSFWWLWAFLGLWRHPWSLQVQPFQITLHSAFTAAFFCGPVSLLVEPWRWHP